MKAVVDTNVLAYLIVGTKPFADETRRLIETVTDMFAPAIWEAELANVVWMAIRQRVLSEEDGHRTLILADSLGICSIPTRTLWQGALIRSINSGIAVYDMLFVEVADREKLPLATFDEALLEAFPEIAFRPRDLLL